MITANTGDCYLPLGVYQRSGSGGVGIILYRIQGSSRGDMEKYLGYGATLELAKKDAIESGNLCEEDFNNTQRIHDK